MRIDMRRGARLHTLDQVEPGGTFQFVNPRNGGIWVRSQELSLNRDSVRCVRLDDGATNWFPESTQVIPRPDLFVTSNEERIA